MSADDDEQQPQPRQQPFLQIVSGNPTPAELAAVTVLLTALSRAEPEAGAAARDRRLVGPVAADRPATGARTRRLAQLGLALSGAVPVGFSTS